MADGYKVIPGTKLQVATELYDFLTKTALPGKFDSTEAFFKSLDKFFADCQPEQKRLLQKRDELQKKINDKGEKGETIDIAFLREIGYLEADAGPFTCDVRNVDEEVAEINGPQLVVPMDNARFAVNAANSRWGSLFDALYESDIIPKSGKPARGYDEARGLEVFKKAFEYLDKILPLAQGVKWADVESVRVCSPKPLTKKAPSVLPREMQQKQDEGKRSAVSPIAVSPKASPASSTPTAPKLPYQHKIFEVTSSFGTSVTLEDPSLFVGFHAESTALWKYYFQHNRLHIVLHQNPTLPPGKQSSWRLSDVVLEAAVTVIMDMEDAVACVDAADKTKNYRYWLKLVKGELESNNGRGVIRRLNDPLQFLSAKDGKTIVSLPGTAVLLTRNKGNHIFTDAVLWNNEPAAEGLLDLFITATCAKWDHDGPRANSRAGSVYIVKPKLHGPEECRFIDKTFALAEDLLGYERNALKVGVMDEERRTSANLKECIRAVKNRIFFINTGFLDRTGDEIHTSFVGKGIVVSDGGSAAGPVPGVGATAAVPLAILQKEEIKKSKFLDAYEKRNVHIGVSCGLHKCGQIGKGMWAEPDNMKAMLEKKIAHPQAGASTAWVPKPIGATLHALHYHMVDVAHIQHEMAQEQIAGDFLLSDLLSPPVLLKELSDAERQKEVRNNVMGLLGYIARWVQLGLGASKIEDINGVPLMEDLATLRISSQHIANWLHHGLLTWADVEQAFREVVPKVDAFNGKEPNYVPLAPNEFSYQCAIEVLKQGRDAPNGYVCNTLAKYRKMRKHADKMKTGGAGSPSKL